MSSASIKKIISCNKKNLIDMVLDIEKYPDFVPWCLEGKIKELKLVNIYLRTKAGKVLELILLKNLYNLLKNLSKQL